MKRLIVKYLLLFSASATSFGSHAFSISGQVTRLPEDSAYTELDNIMVTAKKTSDAVTSSMPVHTLNAEKVLTTGITDISDAMRRLPGVNLRDYGGSGGLKTISVRGLGAQHTGVVYDGVALSDVQSGQIDLSRYSLDDIRDIRLNVGDNDDIYAPARALASAATLQVNAMRTPDLMDTDLELTAKLSVGSFGMINPYFHVRKSNGSNLAWSASADFTHAKNNYPFKLVNGNSSTTEHRENSQLNSGHAELNGIWKPTSASQLSAKVYYYDNYRQLPGPVIYYASPSNEKLRERNAFGQLAYMSRITDWMSLRGTAKFNWATSRYKDKDGKYPGGILDDCYIQKEEYISATALFLPFKGFRASYALDFFHNSLRSNQVTDNRPFRNSLLQAISLKYSIWRLSITARGLLSIYHDKSESVPEGKTESRVSPSAGITFQPIAGFNWHIRTSYKNIFRMPTFNELYFDHFGSINLHPEITDQWNVGTTLGFSPFPWFPHLEVTLDGYVNKVKNKIVAVPYNMFIMTMTNLGKVLGRGLDATLSTEFAVDDKHSILVGGNYSYQRMEPRTDPTMTDYGKQVAYTPLNSGAWNVSWLNPWVNFVAHGAGCSARYTTNSNVAATRIAGYMELGITLYHEFKFHNHKLELRGDVINLLNKQYEIVARYPMPGTAWRLSVKFSL